jgi:beta-aspartyl-dipeptidase (metallo-type)
LEQAFEFAKLGGNIDLTAETESADFLLPIKEAVTKALDSGVAIDQLTISSDSNGSMPTFDEHGRLIKMGIGDIRNLYNAWKTLVQADISLEDALQLVTSNPAKRTGIFTHKGSLDIGKDADLLLLDEHFTIDSVIARGRMMLHARELLVKGTFE